MGTLMRSLTRLGDEVTSLLSPVRAAYVLSGLASSAARMAVWVLPDVREINQLGIDRMVRGDVAHGAWA